MRRAAPDALGALTLRWSPVAGADRYRVHLYTPELREIGAGITSTDTVLTLSPGTPAGVARGDTLLWRVAALRGDATLAQSRPGILIAR